MQWLLGVCVPKVYAKARNNDPAVPFNSREKHFASGRGFAVDVRVRNYDGSAARRYEEGVIIGFWESEAEARRIAQDVNEGRRYSAGHHLHDRAHSAIVVPAWNMPEDPDEVYPWETADGSAEMAAAYQDAGEPIPTWLSTVLARLDNAESGEHRPFSTSAAPPRARAAQCEDFRAGPSAAGAGPASAFHSITVTRAVLLDEELLGLVKSVVSVGETIETLGLARPNRIAAVGRDGVWVETERSNEKDGQAQLVPAWMISAAWDVLKLKGSVSQQALVKNLRITRSAFVCALIARFPGVVTETSPRIALRLNAASSNTNPPSREHGVVNAAPKHSRAGHGVGVGIAATRPKREPLIQPSNSSAATYSASPGGISGNADADSKPTTYAERLNHLFETIHPPERGPFTASEVAEALQAEGIPVHEASLTALRTDAESSPSRLLTEALAYFFNVDAEYLAEAAWKDAARSVGGVEPDADEYQPAGRPGRRRRIHDESPPRECEPSLSEPSVAGIMFSNGDLLRIIGGLSSAARYTGDRVYADRALLRRLTSQISEAAHFLQESVSGGVAVPVRFLEHVIVAWDESSPPDSGTAEDYRWLAELMNRHLSY